MITLVVGYFGLSTFSLFAVNSTEQQASSASAQLSVTPPLQQMLPSGVSQNTYKKSVHLFGEIQKLKDKNQDTSHLESMYTESVKRLTNQKPKEAETSLKKIESEIATINEALSPTPSVIPSGVELSGTVTPSPSIVPSGTQDETLASDSASIE
jgi:hypothetical protein